MGKLHNMCRIMLAAAMLPLLAACNFGGGGVTGEYPRNLATRLQPLKVGQQYTVTDAQNNAHTGKVTLRDDRIYVVDTANAEIKAEFYRALGTGMVVGISLAGASTPDYFIAMPEDGGSFGVYNVREAARALKEAMPFKVKSSRNNLPMADPDDNAEFFNKLLQEPYRSKLIRAYTIRPASQTAAK